MNTFRRPWLFLLALASGAGCQREERNFRAGGPDHGRWTERRPGPGEDPLAASRGPESAWEKNAFALSEGKRLYSAFNCIGCHANGGGDIGPALMDAPWLYGATADDVYASIMDGRPNGMPAFRGRITEWQARQLSAYVRSLSGQARHDAATSRSDQMKTSAPENSADRSTPARAAKPGP